MLKQVQHDGLPAAWSGMRKSELFVQDARSSLGDWEKAMQKLEREGR
jgi:hypothetical protein